jgi:ferredoxin
VSEKNKRHLIKLTETGEEFHCNEEQTVLNAMLALGKKGIPSGCHGGGCGICKVEILSGMYHNLVLSRAHVTEDEEKNGFVLACRMFPETDIELKVSGKMKKAVIGYNFGSTNKA